MYSPVAKLNYGNIMVSTTTNLWNGEFNSTYSGEFGTTIWFTLRAWSSERFNPTGFTFVARSTDVTGSRTNSLGRTASLSASNFTYGASSKGYVWGNNGERTEVTGLWANTLVNEFIFVGDTAQTFRVNSQSDLNQVISYMNYVTNFAVIGSWKYISGGNVIASASRKVALNGIASPVMKIHGSHLMIETDPDNSVTVQSTTSIGDHTHWTYWSTVTGNQMIPIDTTQSQQYFRLRLP